MGGRRVRLSAQDPDSSSRRRALRVAYVKISGTWVDLGQQLLTEGLALWLPYGSEWATNRDYSRVSQLGELLGAKGLWRDDACGPGPFEGVPPKVWVSSNPAGNDAFALDDEYLTVRNMDPVQPLDLSGWWVRDSALRRYTFAPGTVLEPAGGHVTVHVGRGFDTPTDRYWGSGKAIFNNATKGATQRGDGGYLFDPQGDLRASMVYPCRLQCADPYQDGVLHLETHPKGEAEHVVVRNDGAGPVDLFGYVLWSRSIQYGFPAGTVLQPGQELTVQPLGSPAEDTAERRFMGLEATILPNKKGRVYVRTFDDIEIACDAWGGASCSS